MNANAAQYSSDSVAHTERIGEELARGLKSGECVCLIGELGAGKTSFVRGMARTLAPGTKVKSPSFTLLNVYEDGSIPFYHIDLYRLAGAVELEAAGLEDYIYGKGVCVIEWADRAAGLIPSCSVVVRFSHAGQGRRLLIVERRGADERV
ncbi:MAG: tRNA (adenosine(37)-N6)-threonylcarbamoyltransferase complex ATPase subunit type 1 TsaE [Deltaproteobacteria bacterium]|nr:tRNA (adenosine(37)-N6)-threonylcarbamoyltransferase complex ATPase subunit type 1 TsaE [Deltaproteobacteria bacterium]